MESEDTSVIVIPGTAQKEVDSGDELKKLNLEMIDPEPNSKEVLSGIPEGSYKVVSFAIDLTGKRSQDEICQIGAFTHSKMGFAQYIMPFRDVSFGAMRSHGVKVFVTFGKYRVLRNIRNMKILKTKSCYSTLNEFLDWLKEVKGSSNGIILAYHNHTSINVPFFLNKAVEEYKMTTEFSEVVKGIVNYCKLIRGGDEQDETKDRPSSLRALIRKELDYDADKLNGMLQSAKYRAKLTSELYAKLLKCEDGISLHHLKSIGKK